MSVQNALDNITNAALGMAVAGKYVNQQNIENKAKLAEAQQKLQENQTAFEQDTKEAAAAIKAHAADEGLTEEEIKSLEETDINKLAQNVDTLRKGKLTENRVNRMEEAAKSGVEEDPETGALSFDKEARNDFLKAAYKASEENAQRIIASSKLKFNLEQAQAEIKARGGNR